MGELWPCTRRHYPAQKQTAPPLREPAAWASALFLAARPTRNVRVKTARLLILPKKVADYGETYRLLHFPLEVGAGASDVGTLATCPVFPNMATRAVGGAREIFEFKGIRLVIRRNSPAQGNAFTPLPNIAFLIYHPVKLCKPTSMLDIQQTQCFQTHYGHVFRITKTPNIRRMGRFFGCY